MNFDARKRPAGPAGRYGSLAMVLALSGLLAVTFFPLAVWLGRSTLEMQQLNTGGMLVLVAIVVCLRGDWDRLRFRPSLNNLGLWLLLLSIGCQLAARWVPQLSLPLILFGFCAALAAVISFFIGEVGVRTFLPALSGVFVLGLLVGVFPALDWPLRSTAASYAGGLLSRLGLDVQAGIFEGRPPELLLQVHDRTYIVAAECNGFGLLSSSLVLAAILAFRFRLPWFRKIGLVVFAAPTAILFNMLRIMSICLTVPHLDVSYMVIHEGFGLLFYGSGLALIWYVAERAERMEREERQAPLGRASDRV